MTEMFALTVLVCAAITTAGWLLYLKAESIGWERGFEKGYALAKSHAEKYRAIDVATERMIGRTEMLADLNAAAEREVLQRDWPQRTVH